MSINLYQPDSNQDGRFYKFLFDALQRHAGARMTSAERPVPRMMTPRQHESIWIDWDGTHIFIDMSDHIFLFDIPALRSCDYYLKANLNVSITKQILEKEAMLKYIHKIHPFLFLPPSLAFCKRIERMTRFIRSRNRRPYDFFHVVGVYNNPFLHGTPEEKYEDIAPRPEAVHFWIRYQMQQALLGKGLKGIARLTNRGDPTLLDKQGVVKNNLRIPVFLMGMLASRITILNTLPHVVFPWKAMESIALGIPFVTERRPLMEMPEKFRLVPGKHYLEFLPELPEFDEQAEPEDVRAYRLSPEIQLERIRERAEWLKREIRDEKRMTQLRADVDYYRRNILTTDSIARFFADLVTKKTEGIRL